MSAHSSFSPFSLERKKKERKKERKNKKRMKERKKEEEKERENKSVALWSRIECNLKMGIENLFYLHNGDRKK